MKDNAYTLIQRAVHLVEIERYREAIELLMKARASEPENSYVASLLAESFMGLDDNKQGLKYAEEATALDPDSEWGHRLRSIALGEIGRHHDSLSAALEAARIDPQDPHVLATLVNAQISCDKVEEAGAAAEKLRELHPELEVAHFAYGNYCLKKGDHRSAEKSFQKALEINPLSSNARNNLAIALLRKNEERGYKPLFGDDSKKLSILGTGGPDEVHRHLGEAIKLDPTSTLAITNFQNQFRYIFPFYLGLALLPFGMMVFFVNPFWAIVWSIFFIVSVVREMLAVRRKRIEVADDLKVILHNLPRITLMQRLTEIANFLQNFAAKTWPAHALALFAVVLRYANFGDPSSTRGSSWNAGLAGLIILGCNFWMSHLIKKQDDVL